MARLRHSLLSHDGLEYRQTSNGHKTEDFCLMLNCTSLCTNPLSQLHYILFIVAARFISAIPIGQLLTYTKIRTMSSISLSHDDEYPPFLGGI